MTGALSTNDLAVGRRSRGRYVPAAAVTQLAMASAWMVAGWTLAQAHLAVGVVAISVTPVVVLVLARRASGTPLLVLDPAEIFAYAFAVFFAAGALGLDHSNGLPYVSAGSIQHAFVLSTVVKETAIVVATVMSSGFRHSSIPARAELDRTTASRPRFMLFTQMVVCLALLGALLIVKSGGGFGSASAILTSHNKASVAALSGPGTAAWAVFSLPACLALANVLLAKRVGGYLRVLCLSELFLLLGLGILLFGSRLLLTLFIVGFAASRYCVTRKPVRAAFVLTAGALLILISFPVLATRAGGYGSNSQQSLAGIVGYNIFDVSIASAAVGGQLGPELRAPHRLSLVARSILPEVGVNASQLSVVRADVLVVDDIGGGGTQRAENTGFPPTLPTALLVMFGVLGGVASALAFGCGAGFVARRLLAAQRRSGGLSWLSFSYGLWVATAFNIFKDGDFEIDLASFIQQLLVLALVYGVTILLLPERQNADIVNI